MVEYDPHEWIDHLFDWKGSLLREVAPRVFLCVSWSITAVFFCKSIPGFNVPATVHSLVGVALGLLLVFRTNASYDRFWEGRKAWGSVINETRNLGRQSAVLLSKDPELFRSVTVWTIAFTYSMMNRLRDQDGLGASVKHLREKEFQRVQNVDHLPLACSIEISSQLNKARHLGLISDYIFTSMDQNVQLLVDYLGICERIHRTPLPFAYVVHLRRALILYCYTLPFVLVDSFGWYAPLGVFLISYVFLGIEEIGVEIENPFGFDENDLPLEKMCAAVERNLLALLPNRNGELNQPIENPWTLEH